MQKTMIRNEPIIGVKDVEASSVWYQKLLGCKSLHGGDVFEILADENNSVILCLHKWEEHDHPTLVFSEAKEPGHGLILYFRVNNPKTIWENAKSMDARIEESLNVNPNSGKEEFAIRDLDGYYLLISL